MLVPGPFLTSTHLPRLLEEVRVLDFGHYAVGPWLPSVEAFGDLVMVAFSVLPFVRPIKGWRLGSPSGSCVCVWVLAKPAR